MVCGLWFVDGIAVCIKPEGGEFEEVWSWDAGYL